MLMKSVRAPVLEVSHAVLELRHLELFLVHLLLPLRLEPELLLVELPVHVIARLLHRLLQTVPLRLQRIVPIRIVGDLLLVEPYVY